MKNLKIYKNIGLLAGSITLASVISYNICSDGLKLTPFKHNEYNHYNTVTERYTKDGVHVTFSYGDETEADYIVVKKPYQDNIFNYSRYTYKYKLNDVTSEQKSFLIKNIENQKLLLNQEYIKEIIDIVGTNNSKILRETTTELPNDNNYEIEYINIDVDYNDSKLIASDQIDSFANLYFFIMAGVLTATQVTMYLSMKKAMCKTNNSSKILKKEIK